MQIASLIDPDGSLFAHRILSRDECFDPRWKTPNLKALFPRGDHMVIIIDDRTDVWNDSPNVIRVRPYRYFKQTGDINAPEGFRKNGVTPSIEIPYSISDSDRQSDGGKPTAADVVDEQSKRDDHLIYLEDVLKRLHSIFYQMYDQYTATQQVNDGALASSSTVSKAIDRPETRVLLPYVRSKVLKNCHIVFRCVNGSLCHRNPVSAATSRRPKRW